MTEHTYSYDAIVRAEIAIELLNTARAMISQRVSELDADNPNAADALREKRRTLLAVQESVRVEDSAGVEEIIAEWGPRVRDAARLWEEI